MLVVFELFEWVLVQVGDQFCNCFVEFSQIVEVIVVQLGQYLVFDDLYVDFDFGFVLWFVWMCWQYCGVVVVYEVLCGCVEFGFVMVGLCDQCFWVVGYEQFGYVVNEFQCIVQVVDLVCYCFGVCCVCECVVGCVEYGNEYVCFEFDVVIVCQDWYGGICEVCEQFFVGVVLLMY